MQIYIQQKLSIITIAFLRVITSVVKIIFSKILVVNIIMTNFLRMLKFSYLK